MGTVLLDTELCNFLCENDNIAPPINHQRNYNVCITAFDVFHTLSCSKLGLEITRYNEVCDELLHLS